MKRKAILLVTSCVPYPSMGGHFIRAWGLVRALSEIAHLHLVVVYRRSHRSLVPESRELVSQRCRSTRFIPMWDAPPDALFEHLLFRIPKLRVLCAYLWTRSDIRSAVRGILEQAEPQVLWLDLYPMMYHVRLAAHSAAATIMGTHNAESLRHRQLAMESEGWTKLANLGAAILESALERRYAPRYDAVVTVSEENAAFYRKLAPQAKMIVVPNFVELSAYAHAKPQTAGPSLAIVGTMSALFNVQSVLWFAAEILPRIWACRPDARLFVVGHEPRPEIQALASDRVVVTGTVQDAMAHLRQCAALVVPLLRGEGSRLKIIEAMASHVPVVSTTVGCAGLEVKHGYDILIADEPRSFGEAVIELLESPDYRELIAGNALQTVREKYSLEASRRLLDESLSAYFRDL